MNLRGTDRRAPDRAPPEGETSKADRDARAHQHRTPHLATTARGQGATDVRALELDTVVSGRHVRDGDDGPWQGVQRSRAHPGVTRCADVFRRPVRIVATGKQRERQRAPARVLPERNGLRAGGA